MPIGTIIPYYKNSNPYGWLICDGGDGSGSSTGSQTFDTTKYPDLYTFLGTNKVPDYRECAMVGIGINYTDASNIKKDDTYSLGEFKDDCLQGHVHGYMYSSAWDITDPNTGGVMLWKQISISEFDVTTSERLQYSSDNSHGNPRIGDITRGKRKGVNFLIKALY